MTNPVYKYAVGAIWRLWGNEFEITSRTADMGGKPAYGIRHTNRFGQKVLQTWPEMRVTYLDEHPDSTRVFVRDGGPGNSIEIEDGDEPTLRFT